jgi:hypothetical protein
MPEPIWYFADGEVERGPVTEAQLRTLIGTGNLAAEDLVWKEGMEDWLPAGEVPGLFDESSSAATEAPAETKPREATVQAERAPAAAARKKVAQRARPRALALDVSRPLEIFKPATFLGQPLLVAGFVLVLLTRGCDSLGDRYVARVVAKAKVAESQFQDEWEREKSILERRRVELRDLENPSPVEQSELDSVSDQLRKLDEEKQSELEDLRNGKWRGLTIAARDAEANNHMWGFWREGVFWLGTCLFSAGLLIIGFRGQGAERWMCLVMLAMIVFRLFVGWASS